MNRLTGRVAMAQAPLWAGWGVIALLLMLPALLLLSVTGVVRADSGGFTVVGTGLDNPRGVLVTGDGTIYVAESGTGGEDPCFSGPEGLACYGATGAVTQISGGSQTRVATGLPSLAPPAAAGPGVAGTAASGPSDVAVGADGNLYVTIGLGGDPALREAGGALNPEGADLGTLVQVLSDTTWSVWIDVAAYEASENPEPTLVDSNPYSVIANPDGSFLLSDAGGNDLLHIADGGPITTQAIFPPRMVDAPPFMPPGMIPMEYVPTGIDRALDGDTLVGELTGFPFQVGAARVMKVPAGGGTPVEWAGGFTNIIDVAVDPLGYVYVLEIATNSLLSDPFDPTGALYRVSPDGTSRTLVASAGLVMPGGVDVGPDGTVYVTNNSVFPAIGEVLAFPPRPTAVGLTDLSTQSGGLGWSLLLAAGLFWLGLLLLRRRPLRTH